MRQRSGSATKRPRMAENQRYGRGDMRLTKKHISCYRINYSRGGWSKYVNGGWVTLPDGILVAVELLCNEVEGLRGWKR